MSDVWEIIELEDGKIALQKGESEDSPLVTIEFSSEAKDQLSDQHVEIAKVMFSAGMQMASDLAVAAVEEDQAESIIH